VGRYWRRARPCERWLRTISLRLDQEASQLEAAALERHLAACPRCREFADETASLTRLLREAQLVELERPVVVTSPRRVRKQLVRRGAAVLVAAAGLATAAGMTLFSDSPPKNPSSALSFRDLNEQQQYVRTELIRLEPHTVLAVKTAPRFVGHGLL
jgi:anti-sigma factor RsiW